MNKIMMHLASASASENDLSTNSSLHDPCARILSSSPPHDPNPSPCRRSRLFATMHERRRRLLKRYSQELEALIAGKTLLREYMC
ncbi:unnamed protein product [Fusarium graminearum]|nr:unnamed protein product [Fusarium graminearum]